MVTTGRCRFCGREESAGQHRAPGPKGPICPSCVEAGLALVRDGEARSSAGGTTLLRLTPDAEAACDQCGRWERLTFLGFRRPLVRMSCEELGSVICAACLDAAGDLINKASRGQES
ncbi:ClpX C4-type zinc finger [Amycolatopsis xylanica]|uniref:ClpX C4-type zinc finger n=1 Tax=Amycolatopsis xylanica TaxID=589385 RepID=A0A1H2T5S0_9PSEU|nr:ClpX C4-type zinc finger protein [Amycolatopsis xylanica]SDW39303.1 ClpX C4-type zinc finger [Amycolatopsis xylanica]